MNDQILKTIESLIDLQYKAKLCDYDFYEGMINSLRNKIEKSVIKNVI